MRCLAIGLFAALSACTQSIGEDALSVCHPLCRCAFVLPGEQRSCIDSCMTEFVRDPLSELCVTCVVAHADRCPTLIDDCVPVCTQAVPLDSYLEGDAPRIEDGR
jgi:hypothetical protein